MMRVRQWFAVACGVAFIAGATVAAAQTGGSAASSDLNGLVKVQSKRFDEVFQRPGADFRGYTKVMFDPAQVTFAKNWMKDMNANQIALLHRTTAEGAEQIADKVRTNVADTFANAFKSAGYAIVTAPGADVLSLSLRVTDLYINAPETITLSVPNRVYTREAGEATLVLEVRDSTTGMLLGRVVDRHTAGDRGALRSSFMRTTPVSNTFNFDTLFNLWAQNYVKSLEQAKAQPPLAMNVPAQKH